MMKKALCLLLLLCLLPWVAPAEEYNTVVEFYKIYMEEYNCLPFPEEYLKSRNYDGTENRHFFINDNFKIMIETDGKTTKTIVVGCTYDDNVQDFLVACAGALSVLGAPVSEIGSNLLWDYVSMKKGDKRRSFYSNGVVSSMSYDAEKNQVAFIVIKR